MTGVCDVTCHICVSTLIVPTPFSQLSPQIQFSIILIILITMEHLGYKKALAGHFQECVDAVEATRPYYHIGPHFRLLATRFQAAKDLFKHWGNHLGLAAETVSKAAVGDRLDPKTAADVKAVLAIVRSICDGDNPYCPIYSTFDIVLQDATGKWAPKNERKRNLKWMFQDKENQSDHVELFEMIVQRLHELVPVKTSTTHIRRKGSANTAIVEIDSEARGRNPKVLQHSE